MHPSSGPIATFLVALLLVAPAPPVVAAHDEAPLSLRAPGRLGTNVPRRVLAPIDAAAERRRAEAAMRVEGSDVSIKRQPVAVAREAGIDSHRDGRWERLTDGSQVWRLDLEVPGATDLRLGFSRFDLPRGARLHLIGADGYWRGPYSADDATAGAFHGPLLPGPRTRIELSLPPGTEPSQGALQVDAAGAGFMDRFGRYKATGPGAAGACHVNTACPAGEPYRAEIRSVGQYEFRSGNSWYLCTGTLIDDVPRSERNWFLTAAHCVSTQAEAASMVVYWNYRSRGCSQLLPPDQGWFGHEQRGADLRAAHAAADAALLELTTPPRPEWKLWRSGWDASERVPAGTAGIHHPRGDAGKLTLGPAPRRERSCIRGSTPANTHWRTGPYRLGTTEGGSSGSALFASAGSAAGLERRVIGVLSGGNAGCSAISPTQPNNGGDCHGRLGVAWDGSGPPSRLSDWLDPQHTGIRSIGGREASTDTPGPHLERPRRPRPPPLRKERAS